MFLRYFGLLCFVTLFFAAVNVYAWEEEEEEDTEGRANPIVKIVAKIIGSLFTGAAVSCLGEAANKCKSNWKNPPAAIRCARDFLKENKGRCAVGK